MGARCRGARRPQEEGGAARGGTRALGPARGRPRPAPAGRAPASRSVVGAAGAVPRIVSLPRGGRPDQYTRRGALPLPAAAGCAPKARAAQAGRRPAAPGNACPVQTCDGQARPTRGPARGRGNTRGVQTCGAAARAQVKSFAGRAARVGEQCFTPGGGSRLSVLCRAHSKGVEKRAPGRPARPSDPRSRAAGRAAGPAGGRAAERAARASRRSRRARAAMRAAGSAEQAGDVECHRLLHE